MFSIVIVRMNRKIRKQENATKIYGYFFFLLKIKQVLYKLNGWIDDMKHDMIFCWTNIFSEECFSYTYNNPASNVNKCLDLFCFSFSFSGNKSTMLMRNKNKENNYVKRIKKKTTKSRNNMYRKQRVTANKPIEICVWKSSVCWRLCTPLNIYDHLCLLFLAKVCAR